MIHADTHWAWAIGLAFGLLHCSAGDSAENSSGLSSQNAGPGQAPSGGASDPGLAGDFGAPAPNSPDIGGAGGAGAFPMEPPPPPPEEEVETSFRVPVATGSFVWTANPDSGRVALVNARTLEVRTIDAGLEPTYLAAVPTSAGDSENAALVLNVGSADATFFREDDEGRIQSETVAVHSGANAWAVSDSGHFAIAWSDATRIENADPVVGFQDITVLDLTTSPIESTRLSVGYRPAQVVIASDEAAYVVAESSISVLSLAGTPSVPRDVLLSASPGPEVPLRDVSITADGEFALVRTDESPNIEVIRLDDGETQVIELGGVVTDLDLTENGEVAVAVIRETAEVALLPVPGIFSEPESLEVHSVDGQTVGSVALPAVGEQALLFTNAVDSEWLTLFELDTAEQRSVALKSAVRGVFPLADASFAIALLNPGDVSARQGAFAVVPVATSLPPKIQGTDAAPVSVATLSDPARALVTVRSTPLGVYGTYLVRMPELQVDFIRLANAPLATGIVADEEVGFVAQEHPEGRITFIDLVTGEDRTLTGFELASRVIDGE